MRPSFDMDWLDDFIHFLSGVDPLIQAFFVAVFVLAISFVLYMAYLDSDISSSDYE